MNQQPHFWSEFWKENDDLLLDSKSVAQDKHSNHLISSGISL